MKDKLLVIDNYDSFTFNLVQMFGQFDLDISVYRNKEIGKAELSAIAPDYLMISPGPKSPKHSGITMRAISEYYQKVPVLGVCLGMQCINELFGGETVRSHPPVHGKTSAVNHDMKGIFSQVPNPFQAVRYHSLQVYLHAESPLRVAAQSEDGTIMAVSHPKLPVYGIQFHPESFLTEHGYTIVQNFLDAKRE